MTALSIILTGSYIDYPDVTSAQLTTVAFRMAYGSVGSGFMACAIAVFAWTTIVGMYYSCLKSVNYALGDTKWNKIFTPVYMVYFLLPAVAFYNVDAAALWAATDILSACYVIMTLIFVYGKHKEIMRLFKRLLGSLCAGPEEWRAPERFPMKPST